MTKSRLSVFAEKYIEVYFVHFIKKILMPIFCIRAYIFVIWPTFVVHQFEVIAFLVLFGTPFVLAIVLTFFRPSIEQLKEVEGKRFGYYVRDSLKGIALILAYWLLVCFAAAALEVLGDLAFNGPRLFAFFWALIFTWPTLQMFWEIIHKKDKNPKFSGVT